MDAHAGFTLQVTLGQVIQAASFIGSVLIGVWKLSHSIDAKISAAEAHFELALATHVKEEDEKRKSFYNRLDELKAEAEARFITKEVAALMRDGTLQNVSRLETKIDNMRIELKADFTEARKSAEHIKDMFLEFTRSNKGAITHER